MQIRSDPEAFHGMNAFFAHLKSSSCSTELNFQFDKHTLVTVLWSLWPGPRSFAPVFVDSHRIDSLSQFCSKISQLKNCIFHPFVSFIDLICFFVLFSGGDVGLWKNGFKRRSWANRSERVASDQLNGCQCVLVVCKIPRIG